MNLSRMNLNRNSWDKQKLMKRVKKKKLIKRGKKRISATRVNVDCETNHKLNDLKLQDECLDLRKLGWPILRIAKYIGCDRTMIYRYMWQNKVFGEQMRRMKYYANQLARMSVLKGIQKDPDLALRYLKNTDRDSFYQKRNVDHTTKGEALTMSSLLQVLNVQVNQNGNQPPALGGQKVEALPPVQDQQ